MWLLFKSSLAIALTLLFFATSTADERSPCSVENILNSQRSTLSEDLAVIQLPDGTGFLNPFAKKSTPNSGPSSAIESAPERRKRLLADLPGRSQQSVMNDFNAVRQMVLDEIGGGKPPHQLTAQQKLMMERVRNVQVELSDCNRVEAMNRTANQTITLCANALKTPRLALVALMAHEIGHSLDLCNLSHSSFRKSDKPIPIDSTLRSVFADPNAPEAQDFRANLEAISHHNCKSVVDTPFRRENRNIERAFQSLEQNGYLLKTDSGIPLSQNPSALAMNCLSQSTYPQLPSTDTPGSIDTVCTGTQFSEASAQMWGARILNGWVKKNPALSDAERLGAIANSFPLIKGGRNTNGKTVDFDSIYLSEPAIQSMYNCQPTTQQRCMERFQPSGNSPASTKPTPTRVQQ